MSTPTYATKSKIILAEMKGRRLEIITEGLCNLYGETPEGVSEQYAESVKSSARDSLIRLAESDGDEFFTAVAVVIGTLVRHVEEGFTLNRAKQEMREIIRESVEEIVEGLRKRGRK